MVRAVNSLLLALVLCPLLGCAVFVSVAALALTIASLPRLLVLLPRRARSLTGAATNA
jgi:hypothetical protein